MNRKCIDHSHNPDVNPYLLIGKPVNAKEEVCFKSTRACFGYRGKFRTAVRDLSCVPRYCTAVYRDLIRISKMM